MYNSSEIANRIKKLSKERNVTVKKLLEDIGLGFNTMANMRTSMPKSDSLAKIADYLSCSVDYLLGRENLSTSDEGITLYNKLDAEDKAEVRGTMKQMLKSEKYNQDITPTVPYGELAALGGIENPQPPRKKRETT